MFAYRLKRALLSPRDIYLRRASRYPARDIVAGIDQDAFFGLRRGARARVAGSQNLKYFNLDDWMPEAVERVMRLDLHKQRRKSVLDIGTGFGFFPYACEYFSHSAVCTDIKQQDLYDEVTDLLGLKKHHHAVMPNEPLPDFGGPFDVVTAYQIAFNRPNQPEEWGAADWKFFLDDVLTNHLKPGGRLHLGLNYLPRFKSWYSPEVKRVFQSFDAKIDFMHVDIVKR